METLFGHVDLILRLAIGTRAPSTKRKPKSFWRCLLYNENSGGIRLDCRSTPGLRHYLFARLGE